VCSTARRAAGCSSRRASTTRRAGA
jgi:hypothetical protein